MLSFNTNSLVATSSWLGTNIYGYFRWDNTIEIHIGKVKSPMEFQRRIRNTIKYAREKGYLIEYTSGILTQV